jgi:uncharacterized membrane protein YeaQ/YmgE (transglycosylase-associated protein family)
MTFPFALLSWLVAGLGIGLLAAVALPGKPRLGLAGAATARDAGALAGGLAATVLGFGGLAGFDARALLTAALAALLLLLVLRTATVAS